MESKESATKVDCETGSCTVEEDVTNWKTFTPPIQSLDDSQNRILPGIVIEFCNRCRWLHRATWIQTELFLTFEDKQGEQEVKGKYATSQGLKSIQLIPCNAPETGGRFRVWLYRGESKDVQENEENNKNSAHGTFANGKVVLLWDRKIRGGFPELKELKQMVRDEIAPQHDLGHSDRKH